jgi:hypothetical protein
MQSDETIQAILNQVADLPEDARAEIIERLIEGRLQELDFDPAD